MNSEIRSLNGEHPIFKRLNHKRNVDGAVNLHRAKEWERKLKVSAGMDGKSEAW